MMGLPDPTQPGATPAAVGQNPIALALLGGINTPSRPRTPAEIARLQMTAAALQKQGTDISPIASPYQGVARLADTVVGNMQQGQAADADVQRQSYIRGLLGGTSAPTGANPYAAGLAGTPAASSADPSAAAGPAVASAAPAISNDAGGGVYSGPQIADMLQDGAQDRGMDPSVVARVFGSEGAGGYVGDNGSSFGPLQLHYGNVASGSNSVAGMGDDFTKATGLDARDPNTIPQQIAYGLDQAQKNGWGAWHGAAAANIGQFDGIPQGGQPAPPQVAGGVGMPGGPGPNGPVASAYAPAGGGAGAPANPAMAAITSATDQPGAMAAPPGAAPPVDPNSAPVQVAANGPTPSAGAPASSPSAGTGLPPGGLPPGGGMANRSTVDPQRLLDVMTSPYASPQEQMIAASMYQAQANRPSFAYGQLPNGSIYQRNNLTGEMSIVQKSDPQRFEDPRTKNTYGYDGNNPNAGVRQLNPSNAGGQPLTRPSTPGELAANRLPPNTAATTDTSTGGVTVTLGGEDKFGSAVVGSLAKKYSGMIDAVPAARQELQDLNGLQGALTRLQAAGGSTGLGSEEKIKLGNVLNSVGSIFGLQPVDINSLSDLEQVKKYGANLSTAMLQQMSSGGSRGGAFVLKSIQQGQPGLDLSTLSNQRLIGIAQQDRQREISIGNAMADEAGNSYAAGQPMNPGKFKAIIDKYDAAHTATEPVTGQDTNATLNTPGAQPPASPGGSAAQGMYAPQPGLNYASPGSRQEYDQIPSGTPVKIPSKSAPTGFTYGIKP